MSFENPTNRKRVMKIIETIDLIEKSAISNRAETGDLADMLAPVMTRLKILGIAPPVSDATDQARGLADHDQHERAPHRRGTTPPPWESIREMAETAPLKDLSVALAVYMNRVDEALEECS